MKPNDLDVLIKIPEEDIRSGRHSLAKCMGCWREGKHNELCYRMVIDISHPKMGEFYDTEYFCEEHKPDEANH